MDPPTQAPPERVKFCYFCAGLSPPVRVQHTFVSCAKRRKANAREYTPEAMAAALATIDVQRQACEDNMNQYHIANEQVRMRAKQRLHVVLPQYIFFRGRPACHSTPPPRVPLDAAAPHAA